ncbi:DsbA family oxidoreductase [Modicisalibacter luteus]|uniref:DsbA family oxidoreductase n=1 Tax=Modicisalibacter luteus TaxID=453962 RepID=UPI003643EE2A
MTPPQATLTLIVWSDYVCPFCYLEAPELDALVSHFGERIHVEWRAFELRPEPVPTLDPDGDYLHDIWGRAVYPMARQRGMTLQLPRIQPRSRLAHEAAKWAMDHDAFAPMHTELFRGFFEDSLDLADPQALIETANYLGLDGDSLGRYLAEGATARQCSPIRKTRIVGESAAYRPCCYSATAKHWAPYRARNPVNTSYRPSIASCSAPGFMPFSHKSIAIYNFYVLP